MRVCADASESSRWWWRYCIWIRGEQQLPFMHVLCDWTSESVGDLQKGQSKTKPFFDRPDWVWIRYVQNKDRNKPARTCDDIMISCWNRAAYNSCSAVWLAGMSLSCLSGWWVQQRQQPVRWAEWFEWFEWSDFTNFNRLQSFENHQSMAAWQHGIDDLCEVPQDWNSTVFKWRNFRWTFLRMGQCLAEGQDCGKRWKSEETSRY